MFKQKLVLIGGGGHSLSVMDIAEDMPDLEIAGFVDVTADAELSRFGVGYLGTDDCIPNLIEAGHTFHIAIGQLVSPEVRQRSFGVVKGLGAPLLTVAAQTAYISDHSLLGQGVFVGHRAIINAGAQIGANCILNTGCVVEHGAVIGSHCHIAPGAIILGNAMIGEGSFVGAGAVIRESVVLDAGTVVSAGEFRK